MKLIIKKELLSKIAYINSQIHNIEWMGVFAYKAKGKFPSNFVMEAVDVYLVAKGVSAEVGYKVTADLMADLDDAGLLEEGVYRGLIHL
jgi:hypothetical protein